MINFADIGHPIHRIMCVIYCNIMMFNSETYENLLVQAELPLPLNRRLQNITNINVQSKTWPCAEYC